MQPSNYKFNIATGTRVDVTTLQTHIRDNLYTLLEKHPGRKLLVWEDALWGPVRLTVPAASLVQYDVVKILQLGSIALGGGNTLPQLDVVNVIFICRPKLYLMDQIAALILDDSKRLELSLDRQRYDSSANKNAAIADKKRNYHLFFVPRFSTLCEKRLQTKGVKGSVALDVFQCHIFPIDSDVISMERPEVFREVTLERDPTCLYDVARTLMFLKERYGPIAQVWGKGTMARQVWKLVGGFMMEDKPHVLAPTNVGQYARKSTIDQLILIDRTVDLISPLATQLTYEGLIDEIYGIANATARIPAERFRSTTGNEDASGASSASSRHMESLADDTRAVALTSGETLYADLRDRNFNGVGAFLSRQAKDVSEQLGDRHGKSIQELKKYVNSMKTLLARKDAISQHTAIAEGVKERTDTYEFLDMLQAEQEFLNCIEVDKVNRYIEDLMAQKADLIKVLRLICLQCATTSGFKPKVLEHYKREIVQVYGIETLPQLSALEGAGLLYGQKVNRPYAVLRKTLRLTTEDVSEVNPTDISYVHSVYAPLSVRLAEHVASSGGWQQLQEVLGLIDGPRFDDTHPVFQPRGNNNIGGADTAGPRVVLVFFIGGCTFAEISALRFLNQEEDSNVEFTVATTKLINGNTFLESIITPS